MMLNALMFQLSNLSPHTESPCNATTSDPLPKTYLNWHWKHMIRKNEHLIFSLMLWVSFLINHICTNSFMADISATRFYPTLTTKMNRRSYCMVRTCVIPIFIVMYWFYNWLNTLAVTVPWLESQSWGQIWQCCSCCPAAYNKNKHGQQVHKPGPVHGEKILFPIFTLIVWFDFSH